MSVGKVLAMRYQNIITIDPGMRGWRPCIRGMRITVYDIFSYLGFGEFEGPEPAELLARTVAAIEKLDGKIEITAETPRPRTLCAVSSRLPGIPSEPV